MDTEKIVFFLDYATINRTTRGKRCSLDYHDLLHYVGDGRFLIDAYCYVPINPRNEHRLDRDIEELWHAGYIVNTKIGSITGGTYRCNFNVEITMDMLRVLYQVKPDIMVLATGDADFVPLIQDVRRSGVRVEIAAFDRAVSPELLLKCSGFIDLTVYYEEYLAAQKSEREERREELYNDLIQAQESDLQEELEDAVKPTPDQEDKETTAPIPDSRDELNVSISNNEGGHTHGDH